MLRAMARPPNADADATRRRLLESAGALFAQRGVDGVSVRQIAAGAGVSLAMIHHYYGSKHALYQACVDAMYDELGGLQAELVAALAPGGSLGEIIERAVRTGFRFARAHRIANRLLWRQVVGAGTLDDERRARYQEPFLKDLSLALAAASGRPAAEWRLPVQSLTFLISRYALSEDSELSFFTEGARPEVRGQWFRGSEGISRDSERSAGPLTDGDRAGKRNGWPAARPEGPEPAAEVEEHLVACAKLLLGLSPEP